MPRDADRLVLDHYRGQAARHGDSAASTMEDEVVRDKELALIRRFFDRLVAQEEPPRRALEVGCGNGFTLRQLRQDHPGLDLSGLDFSLDMLAVARAAAPADVRLLEADVRRLPFPAASFAAVLSERCLINLLDPGEQDGALREIARVLRPGGHCLMIECFTDGLALNNKARVECGLEPIEPAHHNLYLDKERFRAAIAGRLEPVDPAALDPEGGLAANFLSSHYFIARVLHPLVTRSEWVRNTEFVKFFAHLPPIGDYSPIQAHVLQRTPPP